MSFPVSKPEKTGGTHIKVTVMLFVSLLGLNCRFWSHLGCLGWKVLYLPIQVSLSTGHKEISKKECPDTDHPGGGGAGGTPMNSCWGCAARFSTSLPYFRSKHVTPVFRLGIGRNYVIIYNKIKTLTKRFLTIHFEFAYYSFFHFHLNWNDKYVHALPYSIIRTKTEQNGAKTVPFGATHAYEANTGSTPPWANHTEISLSLSLIDTHIGLP